MSRKRPKHTEHHEHHEEHKKKDEQVKVKEKAEKEKFLKRIFGEDKKSFTLVAASFFVIGVLVAFVISYGIGTGPTVNGMVSVSKEIVGKNVVDYLNNNVVPEGSSVTLTSVEEDNGLYTVKTMYQGTEIPVYATKDGVVLIVGTIYDMTKKIEPPPQTQEPPEPTGSCDDIPNAEKAKMEAWVVSMCPYGTQAMNGMYYVAELFGDNADVVVRFITDVDGEGNPTAMHGEDERIENQRQVCLREEQPDVFWDYINCYVETGNATGCETTAGVDSDALTECFDERGAGYLIQEAIDWETIYVPAGGRGSPSFFMNGVKVSEYSFSQNGRSPNNLKNILCCGMETPLEECNTQLNTANPPTGYGVIGASTASASAGSC